MCGISGLIRLSGEPVELPLLESMTDVIAYRGPDDCGYWTSNNVGFGHRRLSILDLSDAGHQPMSRGNLHLTYNGEIYNYIELRQILTNEGYKFSTATDTEVIIAAYQQWGVSCFDKFNGMWSLAIYDESNKKIICSRDRFGIKPFCYTRTQGYFAFGSESKQLLKVPDLDKSIDLEVVHNYLHNSYLNTDENTFLKEVKELRGGHYLTVDLTTNNVKITKWYHLPKKTSRIPNFKEVTHQFKAAFSNSVALRMRSDVTVGSCLSGGLDSSAIVCTVDHAKLSNNEFRTISSCYSDKESDEQEFIDIVTNQTQFDAIKIFPDLNRLISEKIWDKIIYHQDQPIISFSHFSEFAVFEAASKNNIIVMLDGQGSDEYLAGYTEFIGAHLRGLLKKFKLFSYLKFLYQRSRLLNTPFFKILMHRVLTDLKTTSDNRQNIKPFFTKEFLKSSDAKRYKPESITELSLLQLEKVSIPFQLHSEDRNSMMHSIESRLPFLDVNLVELAINLPESYKLRNGETKAVLRTALHGILPERIAQRQDKKGFPAPDIELFNNNSDLIIQELQSAIQKNPTIFTEELVLSFKNYLAGNRDYNTIWLRAISFNKWRTLFKV